MRVFGKFYFKKGHIEMVRQNLLVAALFFVATAVFAAVPSNQADSINIALAGIAAPPLLQPDISTMPDIRAVITAIINIIFNMFFDIFIIYFTSLIYAQLKIIDILYRTAQKFSTKLINPDDSDDTGLRRAVTPELRVLSLAQAPGDKKHHFLQVKKAGCKPGLYIAA